MRMLDAHPEILCKGEGRFFGGSWRQKSLKQRDTMRPASSLYNALLDAEYLRLWIERSVWSRNDSPDEHLDNLTRMAIDYFLGGELLKSGKRIVGDKSPLLTPDTIREISAIYPEAKVIHIIRDGRDVAVSAAHHARNFGRARQRSGSNEAEGSIFPEGQLEKLAAEWTSRVGKTVEDGPALLGENYTEVRYEDLLHEPEAESQATADLPRGRLRRKVRDAVHRSRQLREALQRQKEGGGGPVLVLQEGRGGRLETRLHPEGTGHLRPGSRRTTGQARLLGGACLWQQSVGVWCGLARPLCGDLGIEP